MRVTSPMWGTPSEQLNHTDVNIPHISSTHLNEMQKLSHAASGLC